MRLYTRDCRRRGGNAVSRRRRPELEVPQSQPQPQSNSADVIARWATVILLLVAVITLSFGLGFGVNELRQRDNDSQVAPIGSLSDDESIGAATLDEIYEILSQEYVDKDILDADTFQQAAIQGVLNALNDTHTVYITPEQKAQGALDFGSTYQGIGATVNSTSGVVEIVAPLRNSPAEAAGIRAGDIILQVDGEPTDGWTANEAAQRIRGTKGTEVTLTILHSDGVTETITIVRGDIPNQSVFMAPRLEVIPGETGERLVDREGNDVTDIAYVNISQFHDKTVEELKEALDGIEDQGYKGLVLDVRANPGGLLSTTVYSADEFLDSGRILSEKDAEGTEQSWDAQRGGAATEIPIVILQDEGSASGAEVLAAALQENGRATVVGTRSFGKGTVNREFELTNCGEPTCGSLYVSIGRWFTPQGNQIEGVGVTPDVEVAMTSDEYIDQGDIQLFRAIEILRGQ